MSTTSVAKAFWLGNATQPLIALSTLSNAMRVTADFDADQVDDANNALQEDLTSRGIATDLESITAAYADAKGGSLNFWLGSYLLQAQSGQFLRLSVGSQEVTLTDISTSTVLVRTAPDQITFAGQVFQYENASLKLSFKFYFASDLPALTKQVGSAPADDAARIMDGILESKKVGTPNYSFTGKRNAFTPSGLAYQGHGDPLEVWFGTYVWRYTDGDYSYLHDLEITRAADGSVAVRFGTFQIDKPMLNNNALVFTTSAGARVSVLLSCSPAGARSLYGVLLVNGITRPVSGTANTTYPGSLNGASRPLALRAKATESDSDFCATNNDQIVAMPSLGRVVRPALDPVAVTYADGSQGTVQITPVRAMDVYTVPPGKFVIFHAPDASGKAQTDDASLRLGWQLDSPLALRKMVEADYYQLRLSLTGWFCFDQSGIDISLAQDDANAPGFISLTSAESSSCPLGTGGGISTISDYTKATTLVSALKDASGKAVRKYRFQLSGRGKAGDNASGTQSGFLKAKLTFLGADGKEKLPSQTVSLPMLCDVSLPVDIQPPLVVDGGNTMPTAYLGQAYAATLRASGCMAPYRWLPASDGSLPAGLAWSAGTDAAGRAVFSLQGTLTGGSADSLVSTWVTVQSNTLEAVTRPHKIPVSISVQAVTPAVAPSAGVIVGAVIGSVAAVVAALGAMYAYKNRDKLSQGARTIYERVGRSSGGDAISDATGVPLDELSRETTSALTENITERRSQVGAALTGVRQRTSRLQANVAAAKEAYDKNPSSENKAALDSLEMQISKDSSEQLALEKESAGLNSGDEGGLGTKEE